MIFIWFVYGLAFFTLGLVILVYPKKGSAFSLAKDIWMIAVFGILHGINEWIDMFIDIGEPFPPDILKFIRMITLSVSFLFLFRFGIKVIVEDKKNYRYLRAVPVVIFVIWAVIFAFHPQRFLMGDICARYLLCLPGSSLTAIALLLQASQFKKLKLHSITRNLYLSAIVFFLYALFAGVIVKKAPFLTANFLNYDMFISLF